MDNIYSTEKTIIVFLYFTISELLSGFPRVTLHTVHTAHPLHHPHSSTVLPLIVNFDPYRVAVTRGDWSKE